MCTVRCSVMLANRLESGGREGAEPELVTAVWLKYDEAGVAVLSPRGPAGYSVAIYSAKGELALSASPSLRVKGVNFRMASRVAGHSRATPRGRTGNVRSSPVVHPPGPGRIGATRTRFGQG